jgi:histidinol phosphatase-like PHP family hydrolase
MITRKQVLRELLRFIFYGVFVGGIITIGVLVNYYGVSDYSDQDWNNVSPISVPGDTTGYNVVFDQHSHTVYSDGDLTVRQNVLWHQSLGFNACVITDHNTMDHKDEVLKIQQEFASEIIVLMGMEYTTNRIHMVFIGLDHWNFTQFPITSEPTDQQMQNAITEAHSQGALVTVNHIPWSLNEKTMPNHPSRAQLLSWGVDYIEIINDNSLYENMYDADSLRWCNESGFGMITGSDMHKPDRMDSGAFHGWILLNVSEFTVTGIMAQLQAKKTKIIFSAVGIQDLGNHIPWYLEWTRPFDRFGSLFVALWSDDALNWSGIWYYVWFFANIFIAFELFRLIGYNLVGKYRALKKNEKSF